MLQSHPGHNPRGEKDQSSYRVELGRILTGVVYTNELCKSTKSLQGNALLDVITQEQYQQFRMGTTNSLMVVL